MYTFRSKLLAYFWCVVRYRRLSSFVWNPRTTYAFLCSGRESVVSLLQDAPHFEELKWTS